MFDHRFELEKFVRAVVDRSVGTGVVGIRVVFLLWRSSFPLGSSSYRIILKVERSKQVWEFSPGNSIGGVVLVAVAGIRVAFCWEGRFFHPGGSK